MANFVLCLPFCWPEKLKRKNNSINFLLAKTCTRINHCNPAAPSISYVINPDGSEGLAPQEHHKKVYKSKASIHLFSRSEARSAERTEFIISSRSQYVDRAWILRSCKPMVSGMMSYSSLTSRRIFSFWAIPLKAISHQ